MGRNVIISSIVAFVCIMSYAASISSSSGDDLLARYMITKTVSRGIEENDLPELRVLLADIGIEHMLDAFYEAQVFDTSTFLRLTHADFQMLGVDRGDIVNSMDKIAELTVYKAETISTPHPMLLERDSLMYGRLYLDGSVSSFEYFQAHFGSRIPMFEAELVWAEGKTGCNYTADTTEDFKNKFVLVDRGDCSFIEKARSVANTGAAAMIVINSDETLFKMAASLGNDDSEVEDGGPSEMAVVMVRQSSRVPLDKAIEWGNMIGRLVPLRCGGGPRCMPLIPEEEPFAQEVESGIVKLFGPQGPHFEFLSSTFGGVLPPIGTYVELSLANPIQACDPLVTDSNKYENTVVVVERGECSYGEKALIVQKAGGRVMMMMDDGLHALHNMGAAFGHSMNIYLPAIAVTRAAGRKFISAMAKSSSPVTVSFEYDNTIKESWHELANLKWPQDLPERKVFVRKLQNQFEGFPEKLEWLRDTMDLMNLNAISESAREGEL